MLNKAVQAFGDLGEDEELGPTDWPTVKRYITSLNNLEEQQVHPHSPSESDGRLDPTNLKDIRIRFLNGMYFIVFAFSTATLSFPENLCVGSSQIAAFWVAITSVCPCLFLSCSLCLSVYECIFLHVLQGNITSLCNHDLSSMAS